MSSHMIRAHRYRELARLAAEQRRAGLPEADDPERLLRLAVEAQREHCRSLLPTLSPVTETVLPPVVSLTEQRLVLSTAEYTMAWCGNAPQPIRSSTVALLAQLVRAPGHTLSSLVLVEQLKRNRDPKAIRYEVMDELRRRFPHLPEDLIRTVKPKAGLALHFRGVVVLDGKEYRFTP